MNTHALSAKTFLFLVVILLLVACGSETAETSIEQECHWQQPPEEIMKVLHAPQLPWSWYHPGGDYMVLADPLNYPPLAELAASMHKLAGMRVNPALNGYHGNHGALNPRLVDIHSGEITPIAIPEGAELDDLIWTADGQRFALVVIHDGHYGLWVGSVDGKIKEIPGLALNPLMGTPVSWTPDQQRLLVRAIPDRGPAPKAPATPIGPKIVESAGSTARSTYEARDLLQSIHDDALFDYYTATELMILDPASGKARVLGDPAPYTTASFSPDGEYLLVEWLVGPWSHEVTWWRFASEVEVWDKTGETVANIASLPLADAVPIHGVPTGPRSVQWRPTSPHTLFWVEALDGGDPVAKVDHRDRLMRLEAPFTGDADEVFKTEHRIRSSNTWTEDGTLMLTQRERMRRWRYVWLLDVDAGTAEPWFDLDEDDRYNDPGSPVYRKLENGRWVLHQDGDYVYFRGSGATDQGDRPFLDKRLLGGDETERLFRCDPERYEAFSSFAGNENQFIYRSESPTEVPNYYLATLGETLEAEPGEATRAFTREPITRIEDPSPQLRQIEKRLVRYEREDGVPLSFELLLPPGYEEGTALPTVLYAYPLEYSGMATAGQVSGSTRRFMRIWGPSHLYFLLQGYAVLDRTAMPMLGDPETTYDTFVPQLVADAEAAVAKAVELGVADPDRIGIMGHSHGALMVANLLAHSDLFAAGIARSGSYNKTMQPFGFQSERRSLFEARDVYIQVSPTFFADQVNEPVLIIHGDADSNPGTLTIQSEVFFEAVRGAGGTARMVLLPHEDHGYRARESVEHVLWEQLEWFDKYVKGEEG